MDSPVFQSTLGREFTYRGIGLHKGQPVTMKCKPSGADSGIVFVRTDLPGKPFIKAVPQNITSTVRCTSLGSSDGKTSVHAVEHLLASLYIKGVDNAIIELDADEIPSGDGSALAFIRCIEECGMLQQDKLIAVRKILTPLYVRDDNAILAVLPFDGLRISYTLSYKHPYIGTRYVDFITDPTVLLREIAPARTFGIVEEIEMLRSKGLALGGTLENAVLIDKHGPVNALRFEDEFVRHKILDLIGDLFLNGRLQGHFIGIKSGHTLNAALSRKISLEV